MVLISAREKTKYLRLPQIWCNSTADSWNMTFFSHTYIILFSLISSKDFSLSTVEMTANWIPIKIHFLKFYLQKKCDVICVKFPTLFCQSLLKLLIFLSHNKLLLKGKGNYKCSIFNEVTVYSILVLLHSSFNLQIFITVPISAYITSAFKNSLFLETYNGFVTFLSEVN